MPKRKIAKTPPEVLAAFKAALAAPRELTAEEEAEFLAFRQRAHRLDPPPYRTVVVHRRGRYVFRIEGQAGADLEEHPQTRALKQRERDFLTELAKQAGPPIAAGVQARQKKAEKRELEILKLLDEYRHRGRGAAAIVARKLGVSAKHVRQVRKKNAPDGGTGLGSIP